MSQVDLFNDHSTERAAAAPADALKRDAVGRDTQPPVSDAVVVSNAAHVRWYDLTWPRSAQDRMDRAAANTEKKRCLANYRSLPEVLVFETKEHTPEMVNCARCARICEFNAEGQRGFCRFTRKMKSTWHMALCDAFKAA